MIWRYRKVFQAAGLGLVFLAGRSAWCVRPDAFVASTGIGSGYFIQSLLIHRHFAVLQGSEESFFSRQHDASDVELEEKLTEKKRDSVKGTGRSRTKPKSSEVSALSWELGYAYASPSVTAIPAGVSAPSGSLSSQSAVGGMEWEALPELDFSFQAELDSLPEQDYRHGRVMFRVEYFKPLPYGDNRPKLAAISKLHEDELADDMDDARVYYLTHTDGQVSSSAPTHYLGRPTRDDAGGDEDKYEDKYDDDSDPASLAALKAKLRGSYPNLKVAAVFNFDRHLIQSPAEQAMSQFEFGPELDLDLNARTRFHFSGFYSGYATSAQAFVSRLPVGAATSVIIPGAGPGSGSGLASGFGAFQPTFMSYPTFYFEEGASRDFNERWTGEFYANQVFYSLTGVGVAVGLAPALVYSPNSDWKVAVGADLSLGGSGTAVLGLLNVGWFF